MSLEVVSASASSTDAELMQAVGASDAQAFARLYDRYATRSVRMAAAVCGAQRAEDAVQDAFLSLWRTASRYDARRGSVQAWIMAITRSRAIDVLRRHAGPDRRRAGMEEAGGLPSATKSVEDVVVGHETAGELEEKLKGLPLAQREVIALAFFGGLTHSEIANQLALPPGTVKGRMRRGLAKMRVEAEA
jgi:RNA polymerase sigma-70 factor (ECF subfamily)